MRPKSTPLLVLLLTLALLHLISARAVGNECSREPASGPLTLGEAIALAIARNPELAAYSWEIRAREAARLQAGLLPNPQAEVELEDAAGTGDFRGARRAQTTLRLSQLVELGGKRAKRIEATSRTTELATRDYERKRAEVLGKVSERFIHVLGDQHELELRRQATELAEAGVRAVERRVQAGKASALEEKKSRVALARSRIAEEHAEHELRSAGKRLAATWDDASPRFVRVEGDLFRREAVPSYDKIATRIVASPDVLRALAEVAVRRAEIDVEERKWIPDVNLSGGVRRFEERNAEAVVLGFAVPLSVFNRNQGGAAEAGALHHKAEESRRDVQANLSAKLYGLYQELRHAATEMETMEREILPEATAALRISEQGFEAGKFSFLELLDAQRTFLEVKTEYIQAATRYQRFLTRIERLIGGSI